MQGGAWNVTGLLFIIGWLVILVGLAMLVPMAADLAAANRNWAAFAWAAAIAVFCGGLLVLGNRRRGLDLGLRSVFLLTSLSWVAVALVATLPLQLGFYRLSFTDALFEVVSGLTTTGATVIVGLDTAPPGLLLWRALLQGLGGVGIILMGIVLLPFLRVGGMQLFRTESSDRSEKLLPTTGATVTRIVLVYVALLILCLLALLAVGVDLFDAAAHSLTAVATGGFSTKDASVGGLANPAAEWVIVLFMLIGGLPMLRIIALLQGRPSLFLRDAQIRLFVALCAAATLVFTVILLVQDRPPLHALRAGTFHAVALITGTGYATEDYMQWGPPAVGVALGIMVLGGCTGSTTGGIKMFRILILWRATLHYIQQLFLPNRVHRLRFNDRPVDPEIVFAALAFVFLFIGSWGVVTVLLALLGLDLVTAVSAAASALANVGPGLGDIIGPAGSFKNLNDPAKWLLTFAMLLGRLEFFTVLVLFHPAFWRR
jgi:trk system potassium uptake protein TrkH